MKRTQPDPPLGLYNGSGKRIGVLSDAANVEGELRDMGNFTGSSRHECRGHTMWRLCGLVMYITTWLGGERESVC